MKLVITYGSFNPPTKADALLFDYIATKHHVDTDVIILTDTRFDTQHPMGVLEKSQVLNQLRSKNTQVRMDYNHLLGFLEMESSKYESILIVHDSSWPKSAFKACTARAPVEFELFDGTDPETEKGNILIALHGGDYDLFCQNYGGPTHDTAHVFNNLKNRVIWTNAETS